MSYTIETAFSPVHETLLSFLLYKRRQNIKYLYVGTEWIEQIENQLTAELLEQLDKLDDLSFVDILTILVDESPDASTVEAFFDWLSDISEGELYELIAPHITENKAHLLLHLGAQRDLYLPLIQSWQNQYMSHWNGIEALRKGTVQVEQALAAGTEPEAVVDRFVTGLRIEYTHVQRVHMIPSFHFRPLHTFARSKEKLFILYPHDIASIPESYIKAAAKALADDKRLQILKLLAKGRCSFTEIVKAVGGAKGNVHHHVMTLRWAGLVSVHLVDTGFYVALRPGLSQRLYDQLHQFLG